MLAQLGLRVEGRGTAVTSICGYTELICRHLPCKMSMVTVDTDSQLAQGVWSPPQARPLDLCICLKRSFCFFFPKKHMHWKSALSNPYFFFFLPRRDVFKVPKPSVPTSYVEHSVNEFGEFCQSHSLRLKLERSSSSPRPLQRV